MPELRRAVVLVAPRARACATILLVAGVALLAPRLAPGQHCSYGGWSAPIALSEHPLRYPSLVRLGERTYVVGNHLSSFVDDVAADTLFASVALHGRPLTRPREGQTIAYPRLAPLPGSTIMMLWGEPDSLGTSGRGEWPRRITRLWAARWSPRGWREAQEILRAGSIDWQDGATTGPVVSSDGVLHLALPGRKALTYLRYRNGAWTNMVVPGVRAAAYASAAVGPAPHAVTIAYVDFLAGAVHDVNSVFLIQSNDDGETWGAPRLVFESGAAAAIEAQLHVDDRGGMQIVWLRGERPLSGPRTLHLSESRDSGRTWTSEPEVALSGTARALRSVTDACGALHVVYDDWEGGTIGHVDYLRFATGQWSPLQHVFATEAVMGGALAALTPDELTLVFLMRRDARRIGLPLLTRYSRLPVRVWRRPD